MTPSALTRCARVAVFVVAATATHAAAAAPLPVMLDPGVTRGPVASHGTTRDAVATTPPASFRVGLDTLPAGARLLTAIAVPEAAPGPPSMPVRFRIHFDTDGASRLLYERVLDAADADDRRWIDVGVALDPVAGQSGTLRFETTPARPDSGSVPTAWWAPPELAICDGEAPSMLLITIDALRADHLGSAGYSRATTPHLDAFAAQATRFSAAFTGGPKTVPSIPQILTGRYFYWHRPARGLTDILGPDETPSRAIVNNPYVAGWLRGERPGFDAVHAGELDARAITSAALRYLTAAGRCPTALYLHYLDTHTPYQAPPRYARRFIDRHAATTIGLTFNDVGRAWQNAYSEADRQRIVDLYDGSLAYTDRQIGRLLRGLARRGRLAHTLVVITADHGEEFWDHRKFFHGQSLYDELLHVPLLVRWPTTGHGHTVAEIVSTLDVVPTIAEAMGRRVPTGDGRSLLPLASGHADPNAAERAIFALVSHAEPRTPERQAVRTTSKKLIRNVSDGHLEIYDLATDPTEKRNLGPSAPGVTELEHTLDRFRSMLDGTGYQLRLRTQSPEPVRYVVDLVSDPPVPLIAVDRLSLERDERIDFKPRASAFSVSGVLAAGDEDQIRFDALSTVGTLKLAIRFDGAPAPDGSLRLGRDGASAGLVVDLADPKLTGNPREAAAPAGGAVVELWRAAEPARDAPAPTLDPATRERLRQLGYVE